MKTYQLILFTIIISLSGCNNKTVNTEKQGDNHVPIAHNATEIEARNNELAKMSVQQLLVVNRKITAEVRENYRSWSYNEPVRWKYLADKFSEEVIYACPESSSKKEEVANLYLDHLNQRASIYKSDAENKQALMGNLITGFVYELKFLIGVEGFQTWETLSKLEIQKFRFKRDSLSQIISYQQKNANKKL
ncbi:MAG: hypothetical protein Q8T08_23665 [Ignavibacteria bacterium]|nr:hypothetical protein [Ignavibacteria bacterium]